MTRSAASRALPVLGLTTLLAVLAFGGHAPPAEGVLAAINAKATGATSATGATWSAVVDGSAGAKTLAIGNSGVCMPAFTLNNNGNVNLTTMTVSVNNNSNRNVRIYQSAACGGASKDIAPGASFVFNVAAPAVSGAVTWRHARSQGGGCSNCSITVSVSVSSDDIIPAGGTTDG